MTTTTADAYSMFIACSLPRAVVRPSLSGRCGPLNQLQSVAGRIDGDADDDAGVSKWTRLAIHRPAGGLDRGHRGRHVGHVQDHMCDRILRCVGVTMHDDDGLTLVGLRSFD